MRTDIPQDTPKRGEGIVRTLATYRLSGMAGRLKPHIMFGRSKHRHARRSAMSSDRIVEKLYK